MSPLSSTVTPEPAGEANATSPESRQRDAPLPPLKVYLDRVQDQAREIRLRDRLIVALLVTMVCALGALAIVERHITVHVQPGLVSRETVKPGAVPNQNVYTFAVYLLQALYRWPANGTTDYPANVHRYQAYFSPACRHALEGDAAQRESLGELRDRVRAWSELPESFYTPDRVQRIASDTWEVRIDARVEETVRGEKVKDDAFEYRVYVVARDVDPQANPYGLLVNCFAPGSPRSLTPQLPSETPR